jgi:FHS family L-fucose permease-like MFS transporter
MLVAAISGGAVIPPMTGAVATHTKGPKKFHTSMAIPTTFFLLAWVFPLYANFWNAEVLDGHRESDLNVDEQHTVRREVEGLGSVEKGGVEVVEDEKKEKSKAG